MSTTYTKSHSTTWNSATTYYIKCEDSYGNQGGCKRIQPNSIFSN